MIKYILVSGCFLIVIAAFGMFFYKAPIEGGVAGEPFPSDGTYNFYYYGSPTWQWTFPAGGYTGVDFDPTDNEGDTTTGPYEVTYVDSLWCYDPDDSYDVVLYICEDDNGIPDIDNPLYESNPYEPDYYSSWDEHQVSPPVQFYGGEICWVVFWLTPEYAHPVSDGDGNSGHSWVSSDGYEWELMESTEEVDWCIGVYAEPGEPPDDTEDPDVTDIYPVSDDWPCGVPPTEDTAGCHWQDGDPESNVGIDVNASTFDVRDHDGYYVTGDLNIDDGDIFDVVVVFDVDGLWEEDESYAVETVCYDLAGNSTSEFWIFSTGYTKIEEKSFGAIKAGFAE
jgi:hypothetical protein